MKAVIGRIKRQYYLNKRATIPKIIKNIPSILFPLLISDDAIINMPVTIYIFAKANKRHILAKFLLCKQHVCTLHVKPHNKALQQILLAKKRLVCYNLVVNFWHSFSKSAARLSIAYSGFVTKLCHCRQAIFIFTVEKHLFVFPKCHFQPLVVWVFSPTL